MSLASIREKKAKEEQRKANLEALSFQSIKVDII